MEEESTDFLLFRKLVSVLMDEFKVSEPALMNSKKPEAVQARLLLYSILTLHTNYQTSRQIAKLMGVKHHSKVASNLDKKISKSLLVKLEQIESLLFKTHDTEE